jgi:hypothetical protein
VSPQAASERRTGNPYVGPRALRRRDPLFGRDRETRGLTDLLIAERIVLLHAPSGAGKTSLIQAGVVGRLESEGFHVSGPMRLNAIPLRESNVRNRYLWSAAYGLLGNGDPAAMGVGSLAEALEAVEDGIVHDRDHVIVIDQFEEILTLDPPDWERQAEFFEQVGKALENQDRWALFSMREDYMGGLDRYRGLIPTRLAVTFRLDFLRRDAARRAMQGPAHERGVDFKDDAAHALAKNLSAMRVQHPIYGITTIHGPYVVPVHLQVICHTLWRRRERRQRGSFKAIEPEDIPDPEDLDRALGNYYAEMVREVADEKGESERAIREWFRNRLITEEGFRSQDSTGPPTQNVDVADLLGALEDRYLIRSDERAGTRWYELSHDRLVPPVVANNEAWRVKKLSPLDRKAEEWQRADRDEDALLRGEDLRRAKQWLTTHHDAADDLVRAYVAASVEARRKETLARRARSLAGGLALVAVLEAVLIVLLAVALLK